MNLIALTGANQQAMAYAGELLLARATDGGHEVVVALHIENVEQVQALRAHNRGRVELWRIGVDAGRPDLLPHLDRCITAKPYAIAAALMRGFEQFIDAIPPTPTHERQTA